MFITGLPFRNKNSDNKSKKSGFTSVKNSVSKAPKNKNPVISVSISPARTPCESHEALMDMAKVIFPQIIPGA